ncbi:MAG: hypothetical protein KC422_00850 [Trueperaceae bacterium]|nr:hypothetical protein [Trueperaceae bacterium]
MKGLHRYKTKLFRARRWFRLVVSFIAALAVSFGLVLAQDLQDGTEVLLTDLNSETIVGHGQVAAGVLHLRLMERTGGFYLYLIFPDGQVNSHQGQQMPGFVGVYGDNGELLEFSAVLAAKGNIGLDLIPSDEATLNNQDANPGEAPPQSDTN